MEYVCCPCSCLPAICATVLTIAATLLTPALTYHETGKRSGRWGFCFGSFWEVGGMGVHCICLLEHQTKSSVLAPAWEGWGQGAVAAAGYW